MKECRRCGTALEDLSRTKGICKACRTRANAAKRLRNREYILEYLADHPCVDCGETDYEVLEFDHRNPQAKQMGVARLMHASISKLASEIQKCDVRCANCHRRRTARQYNWYANVKASQLQREGRLKLKTAAEICPPGRTISTDLGSEIFAANAPI